MGNDRKRGVMGLLCQAQQGFAELARGVQLWPCIIIPPQPKQDRNQLWRLAHLLTHRACLGVGMLHLGRCVPFGNLQGSAEGNVQGQGVLGLRRRLWQGLEQLDAGGPEMADGFHMGRAISGVLARPLPVVHCLLGAARRGVMRRATSSGCVSTSAGNRASKTWATCWCTCCRVCLSNDA